MLPRSTGIVLDVKWDPVTKTFRDFSRNHHTITNHNVTPVRRRSGVAGYFNGDNAYLDCGNDPSLDITGAITIEAWVKPTSMASIKYLIDKQQSDHKGYFIYHLADGTLFVGYPDGSNWNELGSIGGLTVGKWTHIVATHNGSQQRIYIDGVLDKSRDQTISLVDSTTNLYIGKHIGSNSYCFNGAIDEVRIYNRALSADEIKTHYQSEEGVE